MKILFEDKWLDGFLDETILDNTLRVQPYLWVTVSNLPDVYIKPKRNIKYLINYGRDIGIKNTLLKIKSRTKEKIRNDKFLSVGIGEVIEDPKKECKGKVVEFIAPLHPRCMERIVISKALTKDSITLQEKRNENFISYIDISKFYNEWFDDKVLNDVKGWHLLSGKELDPLVIENLFKQFELFLKKLLDKEIQIQNKELPIDHKSAILEHSNSNNIQHMTKKKRGILFGYGNYSKTMIIPNLKSAVDIKAIHEIDPTQIGNNWDNKLAFDTSPYFRNKEWEECDLVIVAGFHHTHAPIASEALKHKKDVIIEKPTATNEKDLNQLIETIKQTNKRVFIGFQRRYSDFNKYIFTDLKVNKGDPINYYCIVFEIPLPDLHWYKWPSSRSRLISNGCHWIDHFLYLNSYSNVIKKDVHQSTDGSIIVYLELQNGACFSMVLTDVGSNFKGLRDYIEIRQNNTTIKITDSMYYYAENNQGIIRKAKRKMLQSHKNMYNDFSYRINNNLPGDDLNSTELSGRIVIELDKIIFSET